MKIKLLLATVLSLCLSVAVYAETEVLDYIVAVVNDDVIVDSRLQREIKLVENKLLQKGVKLPPRGAFERQVLDRMILNLLQLQIAERTGVTTDDNSLNEALRKIAAQNGMDIQTFQQMIEEDDNYNFEQFREELKEDMIVGRLRQRQVTSRINVTQNEIDNFLANQVQQGNAQDEYLLYHILLALPEAVSPEELETNRAKAEDILKQLQAGADFQTIAVQYSNSQTATDGGNLGWRKAGEIPSLFAPALSEMKVGDISQLLQDSNGFHIIKLAEKRGTEQFLVTQTRARHILIKTNELVSDFDAQQKLERLADELLNAGADFAQLARSYSEDTLSASEGGNIGWKNPGDFPPEFEEVLNDLAIDELSQPFKTRFGWHLLQVEERRERDNTEAALRNKATQQIRNRKVEENLQMWLRQIRDEAYVEYRLPS
ncbi:peptidylprolyl isomerase [Candidatus Albibeggiatoa sp. nov. NOAA]|uniref:peptidylprolyl isomerase n=1 Tax=Candidatus Albibeggiatoa sp. nov. NOAA TaxID=3162724 RepID=UPI0032F13AD3|nr:peptidylprolyl isomerase [Thiotrichaceae bacterium]